MKKFKVILAKSNEIDLEKDNFTKESLEKAAKEANNKNMEFQ